MRKTILIGGKLHGQPVALADPALPKLSMFDEPTSHGYTLEQFENTEQGSAEPERRFFYVSDDTDPARSRQLVLKHWADGATLCK